MHAFVRIVLPQHWSRSPQLLAVATERGLEREIENNRTVVVGGDGTEQPSTLSKQSQMEKFGEDQAQTYGSEESTDEEPSWIETPLWPKFSKENEKGGGEQLDYLGDVGVEEIPELELSPTAIFVGHPSALPLCPTAPCVSFVSSNPSLLSRPSSQPSIPPFPCHHPLRYPRRIQSTSSLTTTLALHVKHVKEAVECPTPPPPTSFPPGSSRHTFHFPFTKKHPHGRSRSSTYLAPSTSS